MIILQIDTKADLPYRSEATPEHEAGNIFNDAAWFFHDMADVEEKIRCFVEKCYAGDNAGDSLKNEVPDDEMLALLQRFDTESGLEILVILALAYSTDAVRSFRAGEIPAAWSYVCDARALIGQAHILSGHYTLAEAKKSSIKKALDARHAETRSMKVEVFQWYRDRLHTGITKDAAAEEIAGKLVPMKFRTVRGWLTEFKE